MRVEASVPIACRRRENRKTNRCGWVGKRSAALVDATPGDEEVVVDLEVRHPPPRPTPRKDWSAMLGMPQ